MDIYIWVHDQYIYQPLITIVTILIVSSYIPLTGVYLSRSYRPGPSEGPHLL